MLGGDRCIETRGWNSHRRCQRFYCTLPRRRIASRLHTDNKGDVGAAPLTIIAKLKAKPGAEEQLYEECRKLIAPTLAEEGCINYDMHRSIEDPGTIMFYENWTTKPLWE